MYARTISKAYTVALTLLPATGFPTFAGNGQGRFWPQNSDGRGIAPISPFITESIFSVLRNRKNMNFVYAYIWNLSLAGMPTLKWVRLWYIETRPERPRPRGVLERGQRAPSPSARRSGGAALPQRGPERLDFGALRDVRNHVRTVS